MQRGMYKFKKYNPSIKPPNTFDPDYAGAGLLYDYYLPFVTNDDSRQLVMNQGGQAIVPVENNFGTWVNSGTGMAFPAQGEFTLTFSFLPHWVSPQPGIDQHLIAQNTGYNGSMEAAVRDFFIKFVGGGMGMLVDYLPPNDPLIYRYTSAVIATNPTITRPIGGTYLQVQATITAPSGIWTFNDGTKVRIH